MSDSNCRLIHDFFFNSQLHFHIDVYDKCYFMSIF